MDEIDKADTLAPNSNYVHLVGRYSSQLEIFLESAEQLDWLSISGLPSRKDFSKTLREKALRAETFRTASTVVGEREVRALYREARSENRAQYAVNSPWAASDFNERLDKIIRRSAGRLLRPRRAIQLLRALSDGESQRRTNEYPLYPESLYLNIDGTAMMGAEEYLEAFREIEERRDNRSRLAVLARRAQRVAVEPRLFGDYPDVSPEDHPTVATEVMASIRQGNLKAPVWDRDGNLLGYISSKWKWSGRDFTPTRARISAQDRLWYPNSPLRTVVGVEEASKDSPGEMDLDPSDDSGVSTTESDNEAAQTGWVESNGAVYLVFAMTLIFCFRGRN